MILSKKTITPLIRQVVLFSSLAFTFSICSASIYKWVDAEGNVHYGQQRPLNAASNKMDVQQHAPRNRSTYQRPGKKASESPTKEADKADGAKEKTDATTKPENKKETKAEKKSRLAACARARKNLAAMKSTGRIRSKDKDGNISYQSQKQKEAKMSKLSGLISKNCK